MQNPLRPPPRLAGAVALIAAGTLLFEIAVTRVFSVLFFYHFSFFAISLVMSGLVIGGIVASRWNAQQLDESRFSRYLARLALGLTVFTALAVGTLVGVPAPAPLEPPSLVDVALRSLLFLPGLVCAGTFLALAFARRGDWIGRLYAADLLAAAAACIAAIVALRWFAGPAVLLGVSVLAGLATALVGGANALRAGGLLAAGLCALVAIADTRTGGALLRIAARGDTAPLLERWNEHSRVRVYERGRFRELVIDRAAATIMPRLPSAADGTPPRATSSWNLEWPQYSVYELGRPIETVAIIGVGGGIDLLPALYRNTPRVDGYELNRTMVDLLTRDYLDYNGIARRPEVRLIHSEARVGLATTRQRYDVIQASLIDTWAATAGGGFVLGENALYTREAWRIFIDRLTDTGVLTMTRWHLAEAPAETHRLVALAATALDDAGIPDAANHVLLLRSNRSDPGVAFGSDEGRTVATILVSRTAFRPDETARLDASVRRADGALLAAPGVGSTDPVIGALLNRDRRTAAIAESPFNIEPPTDQKPYFFMQGRLADLVSLSRDRFGVVTQITFAGVRVMLVLCAYALLLVLLVVVLTAATLPGSTSSARDRATYRTMMLYFLGIGLGYILIQVGLHQRLIIVLGHPTYALSVVLFSMLLGSGLGAAVATRLVPSGSLRTALIAIVILLIAVRLGIPFAGALDAWESATARAVACATVTGMTGFALGLAFPLGVQRVAPTGEWAVQKMWAINGAASIAASVLAATLGIGFGSGAVLTAGIAAYGLALLAGTLADRQGVTPS